MKIPADDLKQAADDIRIDLAPEEVAWLIKQVENIFRQGRFLKDWDPDTVETTGYPHRQRNILRDDEVEPSLPREKAMSNIPGNGQTEYFHVPRIIE